ncbi:MAG: hypothetical protein VW518_01150 [Burkholderiaceae bacterium]
MAIPSSITRFGKTEPFYLQVARGQVEHHKYIFKFGFNLDIDATEETIWDAGGIYSYPSAATVMKVSSSSANDTSAGTGARTVVVSGLDGDYNEIEETVSLNGQTAVNTSNSFLRVNRAYVDTAGSGATAEGDIYVGTGTVTAGVPATIYAKIVLGQNQTLMAVWTVPAGYTAFILKGDVGTGTANVNQYVTARLVQRPFGSVFRTAAKVTLQNSNLPFNWEVPVPFTEKTDIEARAVSSGANNQVFADFEIVYIKNDPLDY